MMAMYFFPFATQFKSSSFTTSRELRHEDDNGKFRIERINKTIKTTIVALNDEMVNSLLLGIK